MHSSEAQFCGGRGRGGPSERSDVTLLTFEAASLEGFQSHCDCRRECSYQEPWASSDLWHLTPQEERDFHKRWHTPQATVHSMYSECCEEVLVLWFTCSIDHCIYSSCYCVVFSQCCLTGLSWEPHTLTWERERENASIKHTHLYSITCSCSSWTASSCSLASVYWGFSSSARVKAVTAASYL